MINPRISKIIKGIGIFEKRLSLKAKIGVLLGVVIFCAFRLAWTYYVCNRNGEINVYYVTDSVLESVDPNMIMGDDNAVFTVVNKDPNNFEIDWKTSRIHIGKPVRLNLVGTAIPVVMGSCWNGKKGSVRPEYPVKIDTGYAGNLMVGDAIVKDAGLDYYPQGFNDGGIVGICHLCQLKLGDVTFVHPGCNVRNGHFEKRTDKKSSQVLYDILLGIKLLKKFDYVLIDTPSKYMEFSVKSFDPNDETLWDEFPMVVETRKNNDILFVTIPVNGKEHRMQFDTGAGSAIHIASSFWKEFSKSLDHKGPKSCRVRRSNGFAKSEYYIVKKLKFAGEVFRDVRVMIDVSKEEPLKNSNIMLGMKFFKKRVIVMDFENGLLKVKKTE
ncbi:MAG: hypothetical protein FVQ82_11735 [Planctomycetes bacterium]|nr:hypothetical protein [Planctomycetota bacterium]